MSRSQAPRNRGTKKCRCGENRPAAMTRNGRCYECDLAHRGRKRMELHHPFGRDNENVKKIVVGIPGNWHRALDARREQRPEILMRPGDSPLHRIASVIVTIGEAVDAFAEFARAQKWPDWVPKLADQFTDAASDAANWLLILAGKLDAQVGSDWADKFEMPAWRL